MTLLSQTHAVNYLSSCDLFWAQLVPLPNLLTPTTCHPVPWSGAEELLHTDWPQASSSTALPISQSVGIVHTSLEEMLLSNSIFNS